MRWSSHFANGWVPADPIARPRLSAVVWTRLRSSRSWMPASRVLRHGSVAISQTDSISSGLTALVSPSAARSDSIEFESSSVSASTIISSSSMPMVYAGPVNRCSTRAS